MQPKTIEDRLEALPTTVLAGKVTRHGMLTVTCNVLMDEPPTWRLRDATGANPAIPARWVNPATRAELERRAEARAEAIRFRGLQLIAEDTN